MIGSLQRPRSMVGINITNLVDVTMVLLIIFMLVAPLIQEGIEVELPRASSHQTLEGKENILVTISKEGDLYVQDVLVSGGLESLQITVALEAERNPAWPIYVKCDREQNVEILYEVMALVQLAKPGAKLNLLYQPKKEGGTS